MRRKEISGKFRCNTENEPYCFLLKYLQQPKSVVLIEIFTETPGLIYWRIEK